MHRLALLCFGAFTSLIGAPLIGDAAAMAAEVAAPATARTELQITAYADGLALVHDRRSVALPAGASDIAFEGVAPRLIPASVTIASADARISQVVYDFQLLTPDALAKRFLGKKVTVIRTNPETGQDSSEPATLLSLEGGRVLQFADRIEGGAPGRIAFPELPADLRAQPTLLASLDAGTGGRRDIDVTYLTPGIEWSADYVLILDPARDRMDLACRAILSNRSGIGFPNANLALVAGEINRVSAPPPPPMSKGRGAELMAAPAAADAPVREALGDAYLYTLPRPVSLNDQEMRQLALFEAENVPVTVTYVSRRALRPYQADDEGAVRSHPEIQLSFLNAAGGLPGMPLPAGVARIYMRDGQGRDRLIGEDRLTSTPLGEKVELSPGRAFDITVTRRQTAFSRIDLAQNVYESAEAITLRNAKTREALVRVVEDIPGDWQILAESAPHEKAGANRLVWPLQVPAGGTVELTYRVRVRQ